MHIIAQLLDHTNFSSYFLFLVLSCAASVHGVSTPSPLAEHWKELRVKQGLLELQVKSEKEIAEKIAADVCVCVL